MKIISYNVNGIRAAIKKGLIEWMEEEGADIYCFQEVKASITDIDIAVFEAKGYRVYWYSAEKKGYSGVAIFCKNMDAKNIVLGNGYAISDSEGRVLNATFNDFTLINAYFPSGTSGDARQTYKYQWLFEFKEYIEMLSQKQKNIIILGDFNIAHTPIDIHDPKGNKNSSGFLLEERDWLTAFLNIGFIDSYRFKNPTITDGYTWWSQRFPSVRLQNKGWRIDYICVSNTLQQNIKNATILPNIKHSDHCPIVLEIDILK